jgi:hypothetical protein
MNIISKIALIWAIPIFIIMVVLMATKTFISYVSKIVFVKSGTADALAFLFARLRLFLIQYQWREIKRNDVEFDIRN